MTDIGMGKRAMYEMKRMFYKEVIPKLNQLEKQINDLNSKKPKK